MTIPENAVFVRWMDEATHECLRDDGLRKWWDAAEASPVFIARSETEAKLVIENTLIEQREEDNRCNAEWGDEQQPVLTHADFTWEDQSGYGSLLHCKGQPIACAIFSPADSLLCTPKGGPT